MENDWIKIRTYTNPIEAEIVRQMLEEHAIPAVVLNKQDSSYHFGRLELYVSGVNEEAAVALIEESDNITPEDTDVN